MQRIHTQDPGLTRLSGAMFGSPGFWFKGYDTLYQTLTRLDNTSQPLDLRQIANLPSESVGIRTEEILGRPPLSKSSAAVSRYREWSKYFKNVNRFLSNWNFSSDDHLVFNQNDVQHTNLTGEVQAGIARDEWFNPPASEYASPASPLFYCVFNSPVSEGGPSLVTFAGGYPPYGNPAGHMLTRLREHVADITGSVSHHFNSWYGDVRSWYKHVRWTADDMTVRSIEYNCYFVTNPFNPGEYTVDFQNFYVRLDFEFVPQSMTWSAPYNTPIDIGANMVRYQVRYRFKWVSRVFMTNTAFLASGSYWDGTATSLPESLDCDQQWWEYPFGAHGPAHAGSTVKNLIGAYDGGVVFYESGSRSLLQFERASRAVVPDLLMAVSIAATDAVNQHFERLKSDHIEATLELGEFVYLFDAFEGFMNLLKNPPKGGLPYVWQLLNVLCDAQLLASLALGPTITDAMEIAEKASAYRLKYSGLLLYKEQEIVGKHVVSVPEDLIGFPGVIAVARSRIRFVIEPDSLLTALLPLRAAGLLPSLSTLWNIIPLSFLADPILHVNKYTDYVDTQLLMMAMDVKWSTNSISIYYPYTSADAEEFNFTAISDQDGNLPGYKYYQRFVLNGVPQAVPTRILELFGSSSLPGWGIFGPLIVKLF